MAVLAVIFWAIPKKNSRFKNAEVGQTISFGSYEQDNNTSNGKEEIEWIVLAKEGNRMLVTSKYGLDCQQYNTEDEDVTWETCTLRKWLNGTFLNDAFSGDERSQISMTKVTADKNPEYDTDPGKDTEDKVFLLSIPEAEKYFSTDDERVLKPTEYAVEEGAWKYEWDEDDEDQAEYEKYDGNGVWWLRSPGYVQY